MAGVLVAYATKYGSTREVAEAIARTLGDRGLEVAVHPAHEVRDLSGYDAVIVGGPLYYFHWHRDARRFLGRHKQALARVPVAVFALGPFNDKAEDFAGARDQLDRTLIKHEWLKPVAITVFGGKFAPGGLRFPDRNPAMKAMEASDIRDWDVIAAWAGQAADAFAEEGAGGSAP